MNFARRLLAGAAALALTAESVGTVSFVAIAEDTTTAIEVTTPELIVELPDPDEWSNTITDWDVTSTVPAKIYFATDKNNKENWGDYHSGQEWNSSSYVPEGENYIKFWAVPEDTALPAMEHDAVRYRYDKTPPAYFGINEKDCIFKPDQELRDENADSASGISKVYYSLEAAELTSLEELETKATAVDITLDDDGKSTFSFKLNTMDELNAVSVYLTDNAGNIRKAGNKNITSNDDPPYLEVPDDKNDKWYNSDTRWNFNADKDAHTYHMIADTDLEDWGDYKKTGTSGLPSALPEGEHYVRVWATYDDGFHKVADKKFAYKLDRSLPDGNISASKVAAAPDNSYPGHINIKGSNIHDDVSGISKISYTLFMPGQFPQGQDVDSKFWVKDDDGNISFSLDLDEGFQNAFVIFSVTDLAGNTKDFQLGQLSNDPDKPLILTGENEFGVVGSKDENAEIIKYFTFGSEKFKDIWNMIFANENCYLKLTIKEKNLRKIKVYVDGADNSVDFTAPDVEGELHWWCSTLPLDNTNTYYIPISDLKLTEGERHTIYVSASDDQNESDKVALSVKKDGDDVECELVYDPTQTIIKIAPDSEPLSPADRDGKRFFGSDFTNRIFNIDVSDDTGLAGYSISINGEKVDTKDFSAGTTTVTTCTTVVTVTDEAGIAVTDEDGAVVTTAVEVDCEYDVPVKKADTYKLRLTNKALGNDGEYTIRVNASDLANNNGYCEYTFNIDTHAPVIPTMEYTYDKAALNFRNFGIFGNSAVTISIEATDTKGVGIDAKDIILYWAPKGSSKLTEYKATDNKDGSYTFEKLPLGGEAVPYIKISDRLGNTNTYYFSKAGNEKEHIGQLFDTRSDTVLVLENGAPDVKIVVPDSYTGTSSYGDDMRMYTSKDGSRWFPVGIDYQIKAMDNNSGLAKVISKRNGSDHKTETSVPESVLKPEIAKKYKKDGGAIKFADSRFRDEAVYSYPLVDEGNYLLEVSAYDNAGSERKAAPVTVHLDVRDPQITQFTFGGQKDAPTSYVRDTYGFFFSDATDARVFVKDDGVSSGFDNITLYLENVDGTNEQFTVDSSSFVSGTDGTYAAFTIPKGFKGKVYAKVKDNVGHSSGYANANGCVVEDSGIHAGSASLKVVPVSESKKTDAKGVPLYNSSIPLTVNVEDTFSGISTVEWSIEGDKKSGVISVALDGTYSSNSEAATVDEKSVKYDSNLLTSMKFRITVESNINGNTVRVKLTDRAGNTTSTEKQYSIDTTPPVITSELSNKNASNGNYYNTDQTVKITVVERNFDPNEVKVVVNDKEQSVKWDTQGKSIGTDDSVHTGTFALGSDGNYNYSINYDDMAGNYTHAASETSFYIDKTAPAVTNNFASFGSPEKNDRYFNSKQKDDAKAVITVDEANFYPGDMGITVYCKPAGSPHTDDNWTTYHFTPEWKDEAGSNRHTLTIRFKDDNVYKIVMAPSDRAGNKAVFKVGGKEYPNNTAIFEVDYTAPVICSRNDKDVEPTDFSFMDYYDYERRNADVPQVTFEDTNIDHITYKLHKYTPAYTEGKNIGKIEPVDSDGKIRTRVPGSDNRMAYTLSDFSNDGIYSVKLTAYDKAGNASELNDNTYVRMIDPSTKVLAFIENSDQAAGTGWYSIEDEKGPISKQPESFSDMEIVVFSKYNDDTKILLMDKNTDNITDTEITSDEHSLIDRKMYGIGAYRYYLPGKYFSENYTADADTNLYLLVENSGQRRELGEIYIDNTDPRCDVPSDHFHNWGYISGSGTQTINFDNVSEVLDVNDTVAYVDGKTIGISQEGDFKYDSTTRRLSLRLRPGKHTVGIKLVDKAKNTSNVQEVQHLAVGFKGLWQNYWFIPLILFAVIAAVVGGVFLNKFLRRR